MVSSAQQDRGDRIDALADRLASCRRVLFFGEMGTGKSTLALTLLQILAKQKYYCKLFELQPGKKPCTRDSIPIGENVILKEKNFMVKAVVCDHNIPSVAYALLFQPEITVRKDRLQAMDVPAGPWLGILKQCIHDDTPTILMRSMRRSARLPDRCGCLVILVHAVVKQLGHPAHYGVSCSIVGYKQLAHLIA